MNPLNKLLSIFLRRPTKVTISKETTKTKEPFSTSKIRELASHLLPTGVGHILDADFKEPFKSHAINEIVEINGKQIKISYLTSMPGETEDGKFIPDKYFERTGKNPIDSQSIIRLITSTSPNDKEIFKIINEIVGNVFFQASQITGVDSIDGITFAKLNDEGATHSNPIYCSSSFVSGIFNEIKSEINTPISFEYIHELAMGLRSIVIHEMAHRARKGIEIDFTSFPEVDYVKMRELYEKEGTTAEQKKEIDKLMRHENADEFAVVAAELINTLDRSPESLERFEEYYYSGQADNNQYLYTAAVFNSFKLVRASLLESNLCTSKPKDSSPRELIRSIKSIPEEERNKLIKDLTRHWLSTPLKELYEHSNCFA